MTTEADAAARIDELRQEIRRHDYLYYVVNRPEASDAQYDALLRELRALEDAHPALVTADSPTQGVDGQRSLAFAPVEHRSAMLSLDNALGPDDLREFEARLARALPKALGERNDAAVNPHKGTRREIAGRFRVRVSFFT